MLRVPRVKRRRVVHQRPGAAPQRRRAHPRLRGGRGREGVRALRSGRQWRGERHDGLRKQDAARARLLSWWVACGARGDATKWCAMTHTVAGSAPFVVSFPPPTGSVLLCQAGAAPMSPVVARRHYRLRRSQHRGNRIVMTQRQLCRQRAQRRVVGHRWQEDVACKRRAHSRSPEAQPAQVGVMGQRVKQRAHAGVAQLQATNVQRLQRRRVGSNQCTQRGAGRGRVGRIVTADV